MLFLKSADTLCHNITLREMKRLFEIVPNGYGVADGDCAVAPDSCLLCELKELHCRHLIFLQNNVVYPDVFII